MSDRIQLDCFKSVAGGFVAFGTAVGAKGSTREGRLFGYGCQGETWDELQVLICRLAGSVAQDSGRTIRPAPIEAQLKSWPTEVPLLITPYGNMTTMFRGLASVGRSTPGRVLELAGITEVTFRRKTRYSFICPEREWKPELASCLLHHIEATLRGDTGEGIGPSSEDWQEIMAEILFRARD